MRAGLLRTGHWATHVHAPGLAAHPDLEFVGVWGRDPGRTRALARSCGVAAYDDPARLFAEVDLVSIALPPDIQAELAIRAARAGRHLLLEKPLALDLAAARAVAEATQQHRVASVVFLTRRFDPAVERFIGEAQTTEWYGMRVVHCSSIDGPGNPYAGSQWRHREGGLWDIGPHVLALVLPVLGAVSEVSAVAGPFHTTHALLTHHSGAISNLTLSIHTPIAATEWSATLIGRDGVRVMPPTDGSPADAYRAALDRLVANISGGVIDDPLSAPAAVETVAILAATAVSVNHRRAVPL